MHAVSLSLLMLRDTIVFIVSTGIFVFCPLLASEDVSALPPITANTLVSAITIYVAFALNHARQRHIVVSSAATLILALLRVSASSIDSASYLLYGIIMSGSSLW